jgi:hypothetical protein
LNIYNSYGIAWYYILDTTNTRFKLPRTKYGFEGLRTNVGDKIDESLPNITGSTNFFLNENIYSSGTGALKTSPSQYAASETAGTNRGWQSITFDASRSSSTYQNNAHVQERATQMYLYFYVGEGSIEETAFSFSD